MDQQCKGLLALLGLAWLGLSVLVAVTVGKVLKAYQESDYPARPVSPSRESPDPRGSQAFLASLVSQGPRAVRDRPVIRFKDRPVPPVL